MVNLVSVYDLTPRQVASICDHTFLNRSEAYKHLAKSGESPVRLREKAFGDFLEATLRDKSLMPYAVCVRPEDVIRTRNFFGKDLDCKIASVVGFPNGSAYNTGFKIFETELAVLHGAREIDMVLNYDKLKKGEFSCAKDEIESVVETAHQNRAMVKVILETSELTSEQIKIACKLADQAGADFVKTSTGFSAYGARAEDLKIMREYFPRGIKISGGVTPKNYRELLIAASGKTDGKIDLDPMKIRIGESKLLQELVSVTPF